MKCSTCLFTVCPKRSIALCLCSTAATFLFPFLVSLPGAFFVGQLLLVNYLFESLVQFGLFACDSRGFFLLAHFRFMLGNQQGQSVSRGPIIDFEFWMIRATQVYSYVVPYISPFLVSIRMLVLTGIAPNHVCLTTPSPFMHTKKNKASPAVTTWRQITTVL